MKDQPRDNDKSGSSHEPPKILGEYSLNRANGLYVRKSDASSDNAGQIANGGNPKSPFHVKVRTDWIIVGISILTFIGLGATVYFTKRQWHESQRSAIAAEQAVVKAQSAIEQARDNFIADQRPWIFTNAIIPEPHSVRDANGRFMFGFRLFWRIYFSNYGRSPAIKLREASRLFYGPNAMQDADKFFKSLPSRFPEGENGDTALPPGGPPPRAHLFREENQQI